jgi:CrcB protein
MAYLIVFIGAGIGGALRHLVNVLAAHRLGLNFPFSTLIVNVLGSFLMALIAEYFAFRGHLPQEWRLFLTTGILGGFTTFSTFSLDAFVLAGRGDWFSSSAYVLSSLLLSFAAFGVGMAVTRWALGGEL